MLTCIGLGVTVTCSGTSSGVLTTIVSLVGKPSAAFSADGLDVTTVLFVLPAAAGEPEVTGSSSAVSGDGFSSTAAGLGAFSVAVVAGAVRCRYRRG